MQTTKLAMYLTNDEWFVHEERFGFAIPSPKCPANAIQEFNALRATLANWHYDEPLPKEIDFYITIDRFIEMRTSIGYTQENIEKELPLIYSKAEIEAHKNK